MPVAIVVAVGLRQAVAEEAIVVFELHMVDLQPHARNVDGVAMGGESAVRVVDVVAGGQARKAGDLLLWTAASLRQSGRRRASRSRKPSLL